jgi:hypothetical protein
MILVVIPGRLKDLATLLLTCIMVGGFATHYILNDKFERMAPAIVFTLLLACRLIIVYQVERRERLNYEKFVALSQQAGEEEKEEEEIKEVKNDVKKTAEVLTSKKVGSKKTNKKNK